VPLGDSLMRFRMKTLRNRDNWVWSRWQQAAAEVVERLAEIPTRFYVASACNRQLLAVAAAKVVAQRQHEIVELLASPPAQSAAR
jgi:hypothetical protein